MGDEPKSLSQSEASGTIEKSASWIEESGKTLEDLVKAEKLNTLTDCFARGEGSQIIACKRNVLENPQKINLYERFLRIYGRQGSTTARFLVFLSKIDLDDSGFDKISRALDEVDGAVKGGQIVLKQKTAWMLIEKILQKAIKKEAYRISPDDPRAK